VSEIAAPPPKCRSMGDRSLELKAVTFSNSGVCVPTILVLSTDQHDMVVTSCPKFALPQRSSYGHYHLLDLLFVNTSCTLRIRGRCGLDLAEILFRPLFCLGEGKYSVTLRLPGRVKAY